MRVDWNPTNYQFAWEVVSQYRVWLFEGVTLTLKIALVSMAFAMVRFPSTVDGPGIFIIPPIRSLSDLLQG